MEELVYKTSKGGLITNSLLVARKFDKDHKHVLESIRQIMRSAEKTAYFYSSTHYEDSMNRSQEMFAMNRDGFTLLAMGFTGEKALEFKLDFIDAFNKMEAQIKLFEIPKTFSEALQLAADQAKEIENQTQEIKVLTPKAEVFEQIVNADNLLSLNEAAKVIGIGRNIMMQRLREEKILLETNVPYQFYITEGYFKVKIHPLKYGHVKDNYTQTFVTGKGLTWLTKRLKK